MKVFYFINEINAWLQQSVPMFRIIWVITIFIGLTLLIVSMFLKRNPTRVKSPWIIGGIGILLCISSGSQLIVSLL